MRDDPRATGQQEDWLRPRAAARGAVRYLDTIRERWPLIAAMTLIAVLVALAYVLTAPKRYVAEADILVTPISGNESATGGLGLITASNDPTQTVSTAARLIATPVVAELTKERLRLSGSAHALLADVSAEPIAQSSLVAVQAERSSAADATRVANVFAKSAVELGTINLHAAIAAQLPALEGQLAALPASERTGPGTLGERIAALRSLKASSDPTLRVASAAILPSAPSSPKKKLALIAGLIGGLIVGLGAAFASQALDPRLRREEQLRELFRLPILTHVPRVDRAAGRQAAGPLAADPRRDRGLSNAARDRRGDRRGGPSLAAGHELLRSRGEVDDRDQLRGGSCCRGSPCPVDRGRSAPADAGPSARHSARFHGRRRRADQPGQHGGRDRHLGAL